MATAGPAPRLPAAMSLSKNLVLSRAKASDLDNVRKLNCWGSNLKDLSVLRNMPNIEVITFSVNNISSLVDFQYCQNISELYLRKNNIQNLMEICYLKGLHRLRVLWLSENPCCGTDHHKYRMTVLRNLPQLQKLDNQAVTEEELTLALEDGDEMAALPGKDSMESTINLSRMESGMSEPSIEMESDLLSFRMEETNKIREELGMKLLGRDKFSSSVALKEINTRNSTRRRTSNVLSAVLMLLKELDADGLQIVHRTAEHKLQMLHRKETEQER
ncbi:cilia and flagella associated protein 410 isoform X1 [Leucoraja erinacea]|uniref:cilia and flagella associated protein 410 isoform X1 n=2 Tax=Leucoraja erinaceus TaxID=7782 RepID=UPI002457FAE4|nr:cilia and flagella associated protein 410 isoform X1 [Leucoraja erinacea]